MQLHNFMLVSCLLSLKYSRFSFEIIEVKENSVRKSEVNDLIFSRIELIFLFCNANLACNVHVHQ